MAQNSLLQIRIDDDLKKSADELFNDLGMDTNTAIRLFLKQSVNRKTIPFSLVTEDPFYNQYNQDILMRSIDDMNNGKGTVHELVDVE